MSQLNDGARDTVPAHDDEGSVISPLLLRVLLDFHSPHTYSEWHEERRSVTSEIQRTALSNERHVNLSRPLPANTPSFHQYRTSAARLRFNAGDATCADRGAEENGCWRGCGIWALTEQISCHVSGVKRLGSFFTTDWLTVFWWHILLCRGKAEDIPSATVQFDLSC